MAAYSNTLNYSHPLGVAKNSVISAASTRKLNIALSFIAITVIFVYVVLSNIIASQKYILNSLKTDLRMGGAQAASINYEPQIQTLINFAQNAGMVEAKDTATILLNSKFVFGTNQ